MSYIIEAVHFNEKKWPVEEFAHIGRDPSCLIHLVAPHVEERHARLEIRGSALVVRDLRTQSGTWVNGLRVIEAYLCDGDILKIGNCEFVIHSAAQVATAFPHNSRSLEWSEQLKNMATVAQTNHPVLLLGPSGTGKDVLAHALHQNSQRKQAAFLSVNCSALTETLVESELFGHVKGSFTGAISDRKGAFESARQGTLFLDEVGDLPYGLQAKLLRALENNEIRSVGSDRIIKTDVRIIAATHQNLYDKIRDGSFRSDLFYRLNVINITVPSLQERIEDFEDLLYGFARELRVRFSVNAIQLLKKHEWKGNIRELRNVVIRASALFPKQSIEAEHVDILLNKRERLLLTPMSSETGTHAVPQMSVIKEIERQMILKRLAANHGNQKKTATDLGIPKSTLHDRIKNYHIEVDRFRV